MLAEFMQNCSFDAVWESVMGKKDMKDISMDEKIARVLNEGTFSLEELITLLQCTDKVTFRRGEQELHEGIHEETKSFARAVKELEYLLERQKAALAFCEETIIGRDNSSTILLKEMQGNFKKILTEGEVCIGDTVIYSIIEDTEFKYSNPMKILSGPHACSCGCGMITFSCEGVQDKSPWEDDIMYFRKEGDPFVKVE